MLDIFGGKNGRDIHTVIYTPIYTPTYKLQIQQKSDPVKSESGRILHVGYPNPAENQYLSIPSNYLIVCHLSGLFKMQMCKFVLVAVQQSTECGNVQ